MRGSVRQLTPAGRQLCWTVLMWGAGAVVLTGPIALAGNENNERRPEESTWTYLPVSFDHAWRRLADNFPDIGVTFSGGRVAMIYDFRASRGASAEESAEAFLATHIGLFGCSRDELVLRDVSNGDETHGAFAVYDQFLGDVPVRGAALVLNMDVADAFAVVSLSNSLEPSPHAHLADVAFTRDDALTAIQHLFDDESIEIFDAALEVLSGGEQPMYAWAIDVVHVEQEDETERVFLSAVDGRLLSRFPQTMHAGYSATVRGTRSSEDHRPPDCNSATTTINLANIWVRVLSSNVNCENPFGEGDTNSSGTVTFSDVPNPFYICCSLEDRLNIGFKLEEPNGDVPSIIDGPFVEGFDLSGVFTFQNSQNPKSVQAVNAWKWLHTARDQVTAWNSNFGGGAKITALINRDSCVSSYDPTSATLKFGNGIGNTCDALDFCACGGENICIRDNHSNTVVVHEYGHRLQSVAHPNIIDAPWQENIADSISSFIANTSVMGDSICDCTGFARNLDTPEVAWPNFALNSGYDNGRCMSGAYWDMRTSLADATRSGKILLHTITQLPRGVEPAVGLHALLADDNSAVVPGGNNNIADGSPNYEKINEEFRRHGLAADNVTTAYVTLTWNPTPSDPPPAQSVVVNTNVNWNGLNRVSTDAMILRFRKNGAAWQSVSMTDQGGGTSWQGTIPGTIDGTSNALGDVIDYFVRAEVTDTTKRYTCNPKQSQFVFSATGYTPEERDYNSLVVTTLSKTVVLSDNFWTAGSWTAGAANTWEHGSPAFEPYGIQPGFDFPFDYDFSPGPGAPDPTAKPYCFVTGREKGEKIHANATWRLRSPSFNLNQSGLDGATVSYALWLYMKDAHTNDKLIVQIGDGDAGDDSSHWTTIQTITRDADNTKLKRWIRQRVAVPSAQLLANRYLRFSLICDQNSIGVLEAAIDEIRVWGVYAD